MLARAPLALALHKPWLIQLPRLESQPGRRHSTARPQTNAPFCNFDNHDTACAMPLIESRVREGNATLAASFRLIEKATLVSLPRRIASAALAVYAATLKSDFIETGVYAGGTSILLMKVLEQHNWPGNHWAADSFQGLPTGSDSDLEGCSNDARKSNGMFSCGVRGTRSNSSKSKFAGQFRASREGFAKNVQESGLGYALNSQLKIVPGWFKDTLPPAGLSSIAYLRLDGDLYASTRDAIEPLYPLVVPGGVVYVDDYGSFGGCKQAIDEYRTKHNITETMHMVWESHGPRKGIRVAPQDWHGRSFEASWWIKGGVQVV